MVDVHMYDSTICRLCAADNGNELLFISETGEADLSSLVNRYLPLKIRDDGKLPRTICPGCNIQLEATVQFLKLVVEGQRKLREMWKHEVEQMRKAERLKNKKENTELEAEEMDNAAQYNENAQYEQQIIVKIMPDGSMYATEHEMSLQMEGLTKPRRKRGRPPKVHTEADTSAIKENSANTLSQGEEDKQEEEVEEMDGDGRRRRKRKVPKRFMEAVQGKELERIFKEEGVIDEEDDDDPEALHDMEETLNTTTQNGQEEVIGHLETEEGKDLGELVVVNRVRPRAKMKLNRRKTKFTCQLCGRGFLQRSRFIVHKSFHKGVKHECAQCKKLFATWDNLVLHQKTTKHNSNSVEENAKSQDSLEKMETVNAEQNRSASRNEKVKSKNDSSRATHTCKRCDKQFESKQEYELHMKVMHEVEKFACNVCNKSFVHQSNLKMHMMTHEKSKLDKGYPCDICGKVLNHPSSVVYHKEAEHNNGRRFVCNKCGKSFKHKQLLHRHQLVHSDNRPYICKSCNASFKTKANLINHQSTHTGEKKYFCEICSQQFAHKTSLTLHYRWHTGHKPYTCEICQKSFSQNGNLQEHMRIHTGEKPYCCDYCGRKFTTSSQFKLHVKRHTGERPWKCEFCAKCFLHKDTWKCHVRRHKGERPFQCAHCNRGFTEQWALKKHFRLHTGEKPYSCDLCGKAFADCSNLTKHKKVHKENKMLTMDGSEGSPIGEVWQILPNPQETDGQTLVNDQMAQVITTDEASTDGIQQIIYVSYQDPDDPNQSRTLHFVDANMMRNKNDVTANANSLPHLDVENDEMINSKIVNNATSNTNEEQSGIELSESDLQLQITDEDGNPIPLSIQEARQLLSQGHFISQLSDGQTIRVHSGMLTQQLPQALNIHVDEEAAAAMKTEITARSNTAKNVETMSVIQSDAEAIVNALEDEDTDATAVATINQLEGGIADGEQAIEFTTQDGQKMHQEPRWPACLAVRENLLPSSIPHIPIPIEDIPRYVSLPDYEENCVKTVQTIGEILPGAAARLVRFRSVSSDSDAEIILSLEKLPIHAIYLKDRKGRHLPVWEKCRMFKVFGTLKQRENKVVLVADKLLKVRDIHGSLNTLSLLSVAVRPMFYHSLPRRTMSIFTQCLNPFTGTATWEEKDRYYDYHQEVARSAFADMLHDHERNEKYYIALKAAIEKKHQVGKEANVLDIGTGTGLLSMMAAKCGADTITACEAFIPMANCAVRIIKENGFEDKIKLIRKRSTKMTIGKDGDMPKRANILVTEVFDTELIGEGALSTFRHAHEVLLEKDSIVVPHSGTVWTQVVESSKVCAWNRVKSIRDGEETLIVAPSAIQACSGAAAVHDMQLSRIPRDAFVPLLPPQPIFRFDWSGKEPLLYDEKVSLRVQPIATGTAHAIFMWWELNMDTDNRISLSCAPVWEHPDVPDDIKEDTVRLQEMADLMPWRDHWMQAVYYLPEEISITRSVAVDLVGYHDEYSFWFKLLNESAEEIPDCPRPVCNCCAHVAYSRTRIGQLNDTDRNQKYIQALRKRITPDSVCLCLSDGCLLALAATKLGAKVFLLEQNFLSRKTTEMFLQANNLSERVKIVESVDDLPEAREVDFIFGEPYFLSSIVPWENLRFWYLASRYPSSIARMPIAATIKAVAVEFKDLQKIRAPLGVCESFDLSSFDRLVQASSDKSDNPIEAQPLWEYPCKALSLPFDIIKLDLTRNVNFDERIRMSGEVPILDSGSCNGVALWMDWQLDAELSVSCGPMEEVAIGKRVSWDPYTRQGVHLFRTISDVAKASALSWSFTFVPQHGEVEFDFSVLTNV